MIHLHVHDDKPIPHLAERIARQKQEGGRLVLYRRAWSALVVTVSQDRIELVPVHASRVIAGWRHSLFTVLLGIWSPMGIISVPMLLILNFRGGVDVTAQFSSASIDAIRVLPPDPEQMRKDFAAAQWIFVLIGAAVVGSVFYHFRNSIFPK